jgi:hypothetical protein
MPAPGEDVYLGSILTNVHLWGIISDLDTPSMMSGSFEILGNDGRSPWTRWSGRRATPARTRLSWTCSTVRQSPTSKTSRNLTDDPVDVGKAYWLGNQVYIWDGEQYQIKAMGTKACPVRCRHRPVGATVGPRRHRPRIFD